MTAHTNWYKRLVGNDPELTAAKRAKITTSTLNRQLSKGTLSAENVIALARGYEQNPVEALAATGFITSSEATSNPQEAARLLTDQELIRELARRVDDTPGVWDQTFDQAMTNAAVVPLHQKATPVVPDDPYDDGTVRPWDNTQPHAADNSPDEDKLRWEEENPGYNDM